MDFYLDTADLKEIAQGVAWGLVDGVTTNPSLIAKTGETFESLAPKITKLVKGPISLEVISDDHAGMLREAHQLVKIAKNVVVKIPMTEEGMIATRKLASEGIPVNVTLIFSPTQALIAAKAGASYVSPFLGRVDDISYDGLELVEKIVDIFQNYDVATRVLAASIRHPVHVVECALMGADICTMPFKVLQQLFRHPLTDKGIELFKADYAKIPKAPAPPAKSAKSASKPGKKSKKA